MYNWNIRVCLIYISDNFCISDLQTCRNTGMGLFLLLYEFGCGKVNFVDNLRYATSSIKVEN